MHETYYPQVGQTLQPHQSTLTERLQQAAQACAGLEMMTLNELTHLAQSLTQGFFAFLQHPQRHAPYHLGEMVNQARATPMFLSLLNKSMREFCFEYLPDELLASGLEFAFRIKIGRSVSCTEPSLGREFEYEHTKIYPRAA